MNLRFTQAIQNSLRHHAVIIIDIAFSTFQPIFMQQSGITVYTPATSYKLHSISPISLQLLQLKFPVSPSTGPQLIKTVLTQHTWLLASLCTIFLPAGTRFAELDMHPCYIIGRLTHTCSIHAHS